MLEDLKKKIADDVDSYCDFVIQTAADIDDDLGEVIYAEVEDLPKFVNVKSNAAKVFIAAQLSGEKVQDFQPFLDLMFDYVFNMEDYRNVGMNDGALSALADVADLLDMKDVASRARSAIYSLD